jgi:orotate phosphoribosyltransferase
MSEQLRTLMERDAIVRAPVVLSSGRAADWYADLRQVTLSGTGAAVVGRAMRELTADWKFDAVGGLTLGADPIAAAMVHSAAADGHELDAFVVRKEAKSHGLSKRIEGPSVQGKRVLVVEDTSTTGQSALTAVDALRVAGAEVVGVAALLDRGGGERIAASGLAFRAACTVHDFGLT